jgi:hypothetical protein
MAMVAPGAGGTVDALWQTPTDIDVITGIEFITMCPD